MEELNRDYWWNQIKELRRIRGWNRQRTHPVLFFSTINGYHRYRNTPEVGIDFVMECFPEPNNRFDPNAVIVKGPSTTIHPMAGIIFGHVPRHICSMISLSFRVHHSLQRAVAIYTGIMVHDAPIRGGGPKLLCAYLLEFKEDANILTIGSVLQQHLENPDLDLYM